jgi:hypothetical protein
MPVGFTYSMDGFVLAAYNLHHIDNKTIAA